MQHARTLGLSSARNLLGTPRLALFGLGLAASLLGGAQAARAHVTISPGETNPASYFRGAFGVPHGCDGATTTAIRVQVPEGVISVKPMPKPGWTLAIAKRAFAKSYQVHGKPIAEGVGEIVWSGGSLPDELYDEFVFTAFFTDDFKPGQRVSFPVVQECGTTATRWTDVSAGSATPAPAVKISGNAILAQAQLPPATIKAGNLTIAAPWSRATPNGAKVGGGYLTITNNGATPDRLIGASSSLAAKTEIHEMSMTDGVMQMRPLGEGLTIKPGETVELKPGGNHIMFMDIAQPFKQGDAVKATLTFEKAGSVEVQFAVGSLGAGAPAGAAPMEHKH